MCRVLATALSAAILGFNASSALAGEKSIAPTALPAPIQAAITAGYPGSTIVEASTEVEDGATTYEAGIKIGDRSLDLAFSADGKQLEEGEVVTSAALPAPVQATLATYTGWTVKRCERATASGVTTFGVLLQQGNKRMEVMMDAAGTVKGKEKSGHDEER